MGKALRLAQARCAGTRVGWRGWFPHAEARGERTVRLRRGRLALVCALAGPKARTAHARDEVVAVGDDSMRKAGGSVGGVILFTEDVTELKASAERRPVDGDDGTRAPEGLRPTTIKA